MVCPRHREGTPVAGGQQTTGKDGCAEAAEAGRGQTMQGLKDFEKLELCFKSG